MSAHAYTEDQLVGQPAKAKPPSPQPSPKGRGSAGAKRSPLPLGEGSGDEGRGEEVSQRSVGGQRIERVRVIDWENPAANRLPVRHVVDRLRRAKLFHGVSRQTDAESHVDADHRPGELGVSRQAQRYDRGLRQRFCVAGKGVGNLRRRQGRQESGEGQTEAGRGFAQSRGRRDRVLRHAPGDSTRHRATGRRQPATITKARRCRGCTHLTRPVAPRVPRP